MASFGWKIPAFLFIFAIIFKNKRIFNSFRKIVEHFQYRRRPLSFFWRPFSTHSPQPANQDPRSIMKQDPFEICTSLRLSLLVSGSAASCSISRLIHEINVNGTGRHLFILFILELIKLSN
ncbi:hypothetical protein D0Y65_022465 [Glycine soja]|uniref:Uncharacterized protein n=1 Tax=Glycine soja TaxID=3848 RepID=A0A445JNZ2_GLYSO|nr:hypothetical protein D0Y65_022465 [Glycine soja]